MIGVIGGSGFYEFLKGKEINVSTPYGKPSDKILLSEYAGKKIAFLPRHGKRHQFPPHKINYQANIFALKKLGCEQIIAPTAVGSLKAKTKPGEFVICDQFIDRTKNRKDTFYNGPKVGHMSFANPYCDTLRNIAVSACKTLGIKTHKTGTVVVIEGPRFSSGAESRWFSESNFDIINMTQYPEVVLCRELEMCYANISLVTDYDAGLRGGKDIKPVSAGEVIKIFRQNNEKVKKVILAMIKKISEKRNCECKNSLQNAFVN